VKARVPGHLAGVIAGGMLGCLMILILGAPTATASSSCNGVQVSTAKGLRQAIAAHSPGTKFCLHKGTYQVASTITLKSHDTLIGTARRRDGVTVKTTSAEVIFDLRKTTGVRLRHFAITGAVNKCPTRKCSHPTGRAISGGSHVLVKNMHLYRNHSKAVGGALGGLRIINSEIDHNGAKAGDSLTGGIKVTHSATIKGSFFHDNKNNGIWCDVHCGSFTVIGNVVKRNGANGIFDEISQGHATIANNIVKHNNTAHIPSHGGIGITDSKDANVYGNTLRRNHGFGISARLDHRHIGWPLTGIKIHDNKLHQNPLKGCEAAGVVCYQNR
jgi:hypothetical protein